MPGPVVGPLIAGPLEEANSPPPPFRPAADSPVGKRDWRVLLHFLEMAERGEVDVGRPLAHAELAAEGIGTLGRDALRAEVRCQLLPGAVYWMHAQRTAFPLFDSAACTIPCPLLSPLLTFHSTACCAPPPAGGKPRRAPRPV